MVGGKVLLVTADEALQRSLASSVTEKGFTVHYIPKPEEAVGQLGWPFSHTEVAALVVDLACASAAEVSGLLQIQKDKKTLSLILLRPGSQLSPEVAAPLRELSWPLPAGFVSSLQQARRPVVFLADANLFETKALQARLDEGGIEHAVLESAQRLPEFLAALQPQPVPAPSGLMARLLGRPKEAPPKPASTRVAVLHFPGADAAEWDRKVRKASPEAVCYHVTSDDPVLRAGIQLRSGRPVYLSRDQAGLVGPVLTAGDSSESGSKIPVLLLERDSDLRSQLARTLLGAGYRVELAADPASALKLVPAPSAFHVAILGMTFAYSFTYAKDEVLELSQRLREQDGDLRLIFIVDTYPLERALREMSRAIELGADDAFLKPAEPERLLASMKRALQRRQIMLQAGSAAKSAASAVRVEPKRASAIVSDRYELVYQIGEGGMGVVYLANDRQLGRKVALKRMRPEIKLRADQREKFVKEAQIISRLSHPYILGVHEIVEDSEDLYLVLDYVDGVPLSQLISERWRLTMEETRGILGHLAQAIDYAHARQVLHRDLKPSNIMVDRAGFIKVMDFGLAWEMKANATMLTQKETAGTLAYMAPEQHMGRSGRASDIYALAVCVYEMLTGELPFKGPDFLSQKERLYLTAPNRLIPELPAGLEGFMARALAPEPKERIGSAAQLYEEFCRASASGRMP